MKLSKNSQLFIQEKFLTMLIKKIEKDSYVRDYARKNDIELLGFDYNMFSYMVKGKKKPENLCGEQQKIVASSTNLVVSDNQQLAESKVSNLKISPPISKSIRLIKNVKVPKVVILESKKTYLEEAISSWLNPKYIVLNDHMPEFLIDWLAFLKRDKKLPLYSIQQKLGKIFAYIGIDSEETCILSYMYDCFPFMQYHGLSCLHELYFNCHLVKVNKDLKIVLSCFGPECPSSIKVLEDCSEVLLYKFYKMRNLEFIKFQSKQSDDQLQQKIQRISLDLNTQIQKK